jgi:DNA polymerase-1
METRFLIIDGNSLACRAAFAHNPKFGPDLMTFDGKLTGATYRFISMFDKLLHQLRPTHILVGWDVGRETWRNAVDESYKANREKKNDDFYVQFADIKNILNNIGVKNVGVQGYEGDDILGTYVNMSSADKNYIVSGDKDSFQLVSNKTTVVYPLNGFKELQMVTPDYVKEKYGVSVEQFIDLKAIMGDSGDNVKGIDGCGEKTAVKLLLHYGSCEAVADNCENIDLKGVNKKVKENILEWAPRSGVVKNLVTIRKDVDVPYSFDNCKSEINWENARESFKELEFNVFLRKLNNGEFYHVEK